MDFDLPQDLLDYLDELDAFIEAEIKPLERENDNIRFFDHRREYERTDWEKGGLPKHEWELLLAEARKRADKAGHLKFGWPKELGGKGVTEAEIGLDTLRQVAARTLGDGTSPWYWSYRVRVGLR